MSRYFECSSCEGRGSFPCTDCRCPNCNGSGRTICDKCVGGYKPCFNCNSTGQIIEEKWLIFTSTVVCPECQGARKLKCTTCSGQASIKCQRCLGSGYLEKCPKCGDTRKIKCKECNGSGSIESEWYKSLQNMSVERLRFEYEKIQHKMRDLQSQISRLCQEENRLRQEYQSSGDEEYKYEAISVYTERCKLEIKMSELQSDELNAIEGVLDTKLQ